ncbi:MAG: hypothetical protein ABSC94_03225 [Polyangiaceae bacterium]
MSETEWRVIVEKPCPDCQIPPPPPPSARGGPVPGDPMLGCPTCDGDGTIEDSVSLLDLKRALAKL